MRRFNCCVFNHPCPIFCPLLRNCENQIVNPVIISGFGFFSNQTVGDVIPQNIIPLNFIQGNGTNILPSASFGALLSAGTYQITYNTSGTVPTSGQMSMKLVLNGADVMGSVATATQSVGSQANLSQTIVVTLTQTGILELVNNSDATTTYANARMFINAL